MSRPGQKNSTLLWNLDQGRRTAGRRLERMLLSWCQLCMRLRDLRTTNLFCCLVVDLGHPVRRVCHTSGVGKSVSQSLNDWVAFAVMIFGNPCTATRLFSIVVVSEDWSQKVGNSLAKLTELCLEIKQFFRFKPAVSARRFAVYFVIAGFILLSTVARLTVIEPSACPSHMCRLTVPVAASKNLGWEIKIFCTIYILQLDT